MGELDLCELLNSVLSPHPGKHRVGAGLHWDVKEGVAARMAQKLHNGVEMFEHVRWIRHANSKHATVRQLVK